MSEFRHLPIMVEEVVEALTQNKEGVYLDLTVGLGGHLMALGKSLTSGAQLYGLDRDAQAIEIATTNLQELSQTTNLVNASYDEIDEIVNQFDNRSFDGILLDLGLSSMQIDDSRRGFSFQAEGPLDMRFDQEGSDETAADLINNRSEKELTDIFYRFGEERKARRLAKIIVRERQKEMILTTVQLAEIINNETPPPYQTKTLARIFQALRIAVNQELDKLELALPKIIELLNKGGRLAVLTYHSLEDRIIKQFFRNMVDGCTCPEGLAVCVCGWEPVIKIITKKAIAPKNAEIEQNSRARSAKLRVAEKI